jgi:ribosomal silencing factor RsfS
MTPTDQLHGFILQKAITLSLNTHSKPREYMEVTSQLQTRKVKSLEHNLARRLGAAAGPCGLTDKKKNRCLYCSFIFVTVLTEMLRSLYLVDRLSEYQAHVKHHSKLEPSHWKTKICASHSVFCVDLRTNSDYFPIQH